CPGTQSDLAGKASSCQGCPNQKLCQSGQASTDDPAVAEVAERISCIRHKIVILSGKGGVGKSTFTAQLAHVLAQNENKQIGIMDVDICGPSIPVMMGLDGHQVVHQSASGWSPVLSENNVSVMSIGFMLDGPDAAVIWRGPKKTGMIKKFLCEVDWGDLDYLLIDTPPGTSDEHLAIVQYFKEAHIDGAVVITTPQEISLVDVRKEINFCKKIGINILGVVENMSSFVCPKCRKSSEIFHASTGGASVMCKEMNVPFLGSLPFDPKLAQCSDEGQVFISSHPESPAVASLQQIVLS
ncbi:hypothetical protein HELRODRAFT_81831, partial [Helobdella robusta]|uniref:Cytosolic Fe-S cluster assembly factor NUBP1 homolog n=1 Tax=Helobdella robusta TaxID=6412 RepID=T1G4J3_HELRO